MHIYLSGNSQFFFHMIFSFQLAFFLTTTIDVDNLPINNYLLTNKLLPSFGLRIYLGNKNFFVSYITFFLIIIASRYNLPANSYLSIDKKTENTVIIKNKIRNIENIKNFEDDKKRDKNK